MILSILIPSTIDRGEMLSELLSGLYYQILKLNVGDKVEVLTEIDNKEQPTGKKRNALMNKAQGKYTVFIDSDDEIDPHYVKLLLEAAEKDCDCILVNGYMTTNGQDKTEWDFSINNPYSEIKLDTGKRMYLRFPNHLCAIKREIALQYPFPEVYVREDYLFALSMHEAKALKTEAKIDKLIYHYKYITNK